MSCKIIISFILIFSLGTKNLRANEPNPGYEPYWPPSEEMMKRKTTIRTTKRPRTRIPSDAPYTMSTSTITTTEYITTTEPEVNTRNIALCQAGICPDMFIEYGAVCGRTWRSENKTYVYYTFMDMCELEQQNCKIKVWSLAYRGKCTDDLPVWSQLGLSILQRKIKAVKYAYKKILSNDGDEPPDDYLDYGHYDYGREREFF